MEELLAEFIAETRETLEPLAAEIVAWEAAPDDRARLDAIFRFVHTVKGSCGFLDLPRIEGIAHAAESALAAVRAGTRTPGSHLVSAVLAIIDRIGALVEALAAGETLAEDGEDALIAALDEPAAAARSAAPRHESAAANTDVPRSPARTIRLPIDLLDRMMAGVSDMVLARNELARQLRDHGEDLGIDAAFERLSACVAEMRDAITRTRMQRIDGLFAPLPRMVRDLALELGRQVALSIEGGDVELDREMIEMLRDPLTHIIRNALDHGIEPPADRADRGKPATGQLRVGARQGGNRILIEISDDGRGIDPARLVEKAIAAGIVSAERAAAMSHARKLDLIFEAGLSTASAITAISGRGVGMDVVRANIERIGGTIEIDSRLGEGLRLLLSVPLTLTIIPALTIGASGMQFAVPRSAIEEIVTSNRGAVEIETAAGAAFAIVRGRRMPLVELADLLGLAPSSQAVRTLVVIRLTGGARCALGVDAVHDHEELVVRPAAPAVMATGLYAGTTLPDNGRPMLLIDPAGVAAAASLSADAPMREEEVTVVASEAVPTLLFHGCDGREYAVRLALVERIVDAHGDEVRRAAGRICLLHDDAILPLFGCDELPAAGAQLRILLMSDGRRTIAYAAADVIDIVALDSALMPARQPGRIAGVVLVDGRPVELLDSYALFAEGDPGGSAGNARPLCLLEGGDDPWTREVLRPLIEAAGYRTAFAGEAPGETPAVVIATEAAGAPVAPGAPLIRLRDQAGAPQADADSIYRYDRAGLLAALGRAAGR